MAVVLHEHCQQNHEHLLFTGREFVWKQQFSVLIEGYVIPTAVYLFAGVAEKFVNHILKTTFGKGEGGGFAALFLVIAGKHFDHLIADIDLIIEIAALQQIQLPVQFGLHVLVCHACREVTHNQGAVVAADHIVWDISRCGIIKEEVYSVLCVAFHFTGELYVAGKLFEVSHRTVQNSGLSHSVDAGKDIHIRTQIPLYIKAGPESFDLDPPDIVCLLFHNIQF